MVIYYLAWVCNSGMEWTLKLNNLFLWWMQLKSLLKPFCTNTLTETDIDILAFTWSKLILHIASTWYCSCDWTVNSAATTIEIEVAYSSHSYWYCNCDCIVNTVATAIGIEIVFSCDNNWYCSCDWTLYAASIAIETEIESPMLEELKLKLISTSKLWYYCYCSRSWTTCKKIPKSYRAQKKGIVQPWRKYVRWMN